MSVASFLNKINQLFLNPLIILLFAVAILIFFVGIFQFINSETADDSREKGKKKIFYGLIGMFVMFSAYGLIHLVLSTFHIQPPTYLQEKIGN